MVLLWENIGTNEKALVCYCETHRNGARRHVTASRHGVTASYGRFGCLGEGSKPLGDLINMALLWYFIQIKIRTFLGVLVWVPNHGKILLVWINFGTVFIQIKIGRAHRRVRDVTDDCKSSGPCKNYYVVQLDGSVLIWHMTDWLSTAFCILFIWGALKK